MFVKASALILILICFFVHACNARRLPAANSISHKVKSHHTEIEDKLKSNVNSFSPNDLPSKNAGVNQKETEDICKKNQGIDGTNTDLISRSEDCTKPYSHHKALLQYSTNSEGSRWTHVNAREMDLHTQLFREGYFSETDYQPPHRKTPIHNK